MTDNPNFAARKVAFGDILREAMRDKQVGTRELAARMGGNVRRQMIQSILSGRVEPSLEMWGRMCKALDLL